jgi:hypothetical protein
VLKTHWSLLFFRIITPYVNVPVPEVLLVAAQSDPRIGGIAINFEPFGTELLVIYQ